MADDAQSVDQNEIEELLKKAQSGDGEGAAPSQPAPGEEAGPALHPDEIETLQNKGKSKDSQEPKAPQTADPSPPHEAVAPQPKTPQRILLLIAHVVGDLEGSFGERDTAPRGQVSLQAAAAQESRMFSPRVQEHLVTRLGIGRALSSQHRGQHNVFTGRSPGVERVDQCTHAHG